MTPKMLWRPQEEASDGLHNIFCGITKRFQKVFSLIFNVVSFIIVNMERVQHIEIVFCYWIETRDY